jgi:hypothetical protein
MSESIEKIYNIPVTGFLFKTIFAPVKLMMNIVIVRDISYLCFDSLH